MRHFIFFSDKQNIEPVTAELCTLVKAAVYAALEYEDFKRSAEISVTFTDDRGIREINREFRKIDTPTDVLSFPIAEGDESEIDPSNGALILGDIVISLERARIQSVEYGHSYTREVAFLTVHSVLHLLGYDHLTSESDEAKMLRRQEAVLEVMGITRNKN